MATFLVLCRSSSGLRTALANLEKGAKDRPIKAGRKGREADLANRFNIVYKFNSDK